MHVSARRAQTIRMKKRIHQGSSTRSGVRRRNVQPSCPTSGCLEMMGKHQQPHLHCIPTPSACKLHLLGQLGVCSRSVLPACIAHQRHAGACGPSTEPLSGVHSHGLPGWKIVGWGSYLTHTGLLEAVRALAAGSATGSLQVAAAQTPAPATSIHSAVLSRCPNGAWSLIPSPGTAAATLPTPARAASRHTAHTSQGRRTRMSGPPCFPPARLLLPSGTA